MRLGVLQETYPNERRVALIPALVPMYAKLGFEVLVQSGAGEGAYHTDDAYRQRARPCCPRARKCWRKRILC